MGKAIVELHKECLDAGGQEVYPHGRRVVTGAREPHERLIYCRLGHPFFGRDSERGRLMRRTDEANGMWIPEWLLVEVPDKEDAHDAHL